MSEDRDQKRIELIAATRRGVSEFLSTTRGAAMFGSDVHIVEVPSKLGFCVVHGDDERVYVDTMEM